MIFFLQGLDDLIFDLIRVFDLVRNQQVKNEIDLIFAIDHAEIVERKLRINGMNRLIDLGADREHPFVVGFDGIHMDDQENVQLLADFPLGFVDDLMGSADIRILRHLRVNGSDAPAGSVVVYDEVMGSHDAVVAFHHFCDGRAGFRISRSSDQRGKRISGDADTRPYDDGSHDKADETVHIQMEEVEDQDGQDRDGSGDHIAHGVSGGGHHDLGINLFSKGTVKTTHPEFDTDGKNQNHHRNGMESQLFGMQDFFKGILEKAKAHIQNQEGDDQGRDVLDPPVAERMMPLQETCMFNGTQKNLFWKKMKQILGEKDLFLISISYICEEKEKNRWKQAMYAYPFEGAEEILFAMSILPDDETLWEGIKQKLADSFSKNRKISVFTEWNLFVWMVGKVMTRLKGYRKKDLDILKLLVKLTGTNAKNADAVLEKRMHMFGYSDKETAFLNFVLMYFVKRPDRISLSGLTAEKIGLNVLEAFLPGKETYPEEAYVLCSRILRTYGKLSVRIDGKERLEKCMNETFRVENVKTFLTLFPFRSNEPEEWHYIDLTEEKWDPLVKELSSEEFEACVTDTLKGKTYSTKSLLKYLERYENLTGSRYQDVFWKKSEPELYAVFNRLILHGILDGKKYLEEFVKDYKNEEPDLEKKWEFMAGYLKSEIKGLCNEHSYPMLKFLINEIGMDGCEFLSPWRILKETFSLGYYAIQHRECEFFSPVLGKKEHRELFSMVEKKFFYEYPDIYPEYLTALLLKESTALWLEQSEAYELSKLLLPFISDSYRRETLYQKYMTEEDRKRYQERKEWLKEQKKRIDHWKTEKNIKQQFNQILRENRKTDKEIQSIYEFYKNGRYSYGHKKLYCKIVSSYLKDNFAGTAKKPMAKKEALYLLKLAENMYQDECMELPEITELIERAEVA